MYNSSSWFNLLLEVTLGILGKMQICAWTNDNSWGKKPVSVISNKIEADRLHFVIRACGDAGHCRRILQQALNSVTDWPEYITKAYIDFEREEGKMDQKKKLLEIETETWSLFLSAILQSVF